MTFTVGFPNLLASGSLAITAGETALTIGTTHFGTIAQVSGIGAGFNLFAPTAGLNYRLVISGKDAADGAAPTNAFIDVLQLNGTLGWVPTVLSSTNTLGAPGARTYTNNAASLKIAVATGITWYVDVIVERFAS